MVDSKASNRRQQHNPKNGGHGHHQRNNHRHNNNTNNSAGDVLGAGAAKLKKKIRDTERLLKKDNLPAHVRVDNERSLKALRVDLANTQQSSKAKIIAKKYHMVRFFEKKKAIRRLKQAMKTVEEVSKTEVRKEIKKARKVVHHCEIDVAYVVLFPKEEKYISLYANAKEGEDAATINNPKAKKGMQLTEERKRELRKGVEKLMDDGKLPFTFEDVLAGKTLKVDTTIFSNVKPIEEIDAPTTKSKKQEVKKEEDDEEDDEFFE